MALSLTDIKRRLQDCGIVGAGGAGFPSYAKLQETGISTVILNCAECEPLLSVDKLLLANFAREIFEALKIISDAVGCDVIIAVKRAYCAAVSACKQIVSDYSFTITELPDIYPTGDEVALIYECTGKTVPEGKIPISVGVVVYNVETVLNMYYALKHNEPVIYKYVTIAGELKTPKTVKVPLGTSFSELIELCGGTIQNTAVISGGPMTGRLAGMNDTVTKTTKGILVLPENSFVVRSKKTNVKTEIKHAMSVCSQCRMCTDLCPRYLLGHSVEPHRFMRAVSIGLTEDLTPFVNSLSCCECGICEMFACHQGLSPRKLMAEYKRELRAKGVTAKSKESCKTNSMFKYRRLSEHRLIMRLGLNEYKTPSEIEDLGRFGNLTLMLSQSIGAPSSAIVKKGDSVTKGAVLAEAAQGKLSLPLHSPVDGIVSDVTDKYIRVANNE